MHLILMSDERKLHLIVKWWLTSYDINNVSLSMYITILKEINDPRKELEDKSYHYVTRKSNREADFLAKLALSLPIGWHVWLLPSPDLYSYPKIL